MSKQRNNPTDDVGNVIDQVSDDRAQENKKYLKYTALFLLGIFLGMVFHYLFISCR